MSNCEHREYEPVYGTSHDRPNWGASAPLAHICTACFEQLPDWWGCEFCETYEIRKLSDRVPTVLLGKPCWLHRESR